MGTGSSAGAALSAAGNAFSVGTGSSAGAALCAAGTASSAADSSPEDCSSRAFFSSCFSLSSFFLSSSSFLACRCLSYSFAPVVFCLKSASCRACSAIFSLSSAACCSLAALFSASASASILFKAPALAFAAISLLSGSHSVFGVLLPASAAANP